MKGSPRGVTERWVGGLRVKGNDKEKKARDFRRLGRKLEHRVQERRKTVRGPWLNLFKRGPSSGKGRRGRVGTLLTSPKPLKRRKRKSLQQVRTPPLNLKMWFWELEASSHGDRRKKPGRREKEVQVIMSVRKLGKHSARGKGSMHKKRRIRRKSKEKVARVGGL